MIVETLWQCREQQIIDDFRIQNLNPIFLRDRGTMKMFGINMRGLWGNFLDEKNWNHQMTVLSQKVRIAFPSLDVEFSSDVIVVKGPPIHLSIILF